MIDSKKTLGNFSGDRRTSLRMSKLARMRQTATAKTNWNETVRMLFWADDDRGRSEEVRRLVLGDTQHATNRGAAESYSPDQFQYILRLMLIISIAEQHTQELYRKEFAERCDVISKVYHLQDDEYWDAGNVPVEWESLNREFDERSGQILSETLREYGQDDIARLMEKHGADELFSIVENVRLQFFRVLESLPRERRDPDMRNEGSIPETLPSTPPKDS